MPGVDRSRDDALPGLAQQLGGESGQRRDADNRNAQRKTHRPSQRQADPDAGERTRARGDGDAVERRDAALDASKHLLDHGRQRLGMPTQHRPADDREGLHPSTLHHRRRRRRAAGSIDRQDAHGRV